MWVKVKAVGLPRNLEADPQAADAITIPQSRSTKVPLFSYDFLV